MNNCKTSGDDSGTLIRSGSMKKISTRSGQAISAAGEVELREEPDWQSLRLAVRVDVLDGALLAVLLNHSPAGSIVVLGRESELALGANEREALAGGIPSVRGIPTVMVATLDRTAVLTGAFPTAGCSRAGRWRKPRLRRALRAPTV